MPWTASHPRIGAVGLQSTRASKALSRLGSALVPLLMLTGLSGAAMAQAADVLKVTASWNLPNTEEGIRQAVGKAKELGFNAYAFTGFHRSAILADECRKQGMFGIRVIEPLRKQPGARLQVIEKGEETWPGFVPVGSDALYQYGGEPLPRHPEMCDRELVCPRDAGVVEYTVSEVRKASANGFGGVCWDFLGYRNYHSCACADCLAALAEYQAKHPDLPADQAKAAFYEDGLVDLYAKLYAATKELDPKMTVLSHVLPPYLPNLFYGRRVRVDYCAMTVCWFFQPHWPLDQVTERTRIAVQGPYADSGTIGMPMIGYYNSGSMAGHRRSAERVAQELQIVAEQGAKSVMICELGDILADPAVSEAVRKGLAAIR